MTNRCVAIVTGGTKGLGREIALGCGRAGLEVISVYRADVASAEAFNREAATAKFRCSIVRHDVACGDFEKNVLSLVPPGVRLLLVNNAAASFEPQPFHLLQWDDFNRQLETGVCGAFNAIQATLPRMVRARSGVIVNVLSSALSTIPKGFSAYVTAKSALLGFTQAIAAEYAPRGVKIFAVSPGFMETSLTAGWNSLLKTAEASSPAAVASAIVNLALDPATRGLGENLIV